MSSSPVEWRTPTSSSPSRILIAMIPSALSGVLYAASSVFLTMPVLRREDEVLGLLEVARLDHRAHLLVLAERQQVLTIARPFDWRDPSGSSCTLSR